MIIKIMLINWNQMLLDLKIHQSSKVHNIKFNVLTIILYRILWLKILLSKKVYLAWIFYKI